MLRRPTWGLALLAGALFPLGLAPFDLWPIIPVSAGIFYAALSTSAPTPFWRQGFAYGVGFFGAGVSWVYVSIHVYGNTPTWLALCLTAIFCGGLALLFSFQAALFQRLASQNWGWRIVQFASLWVLFEWLRSWLLTGFPWAFAGYAALDSPLDSWIPMLGVYGLSWLLIALGCLWIGAIAHPRVTVRWVTAAISTGAILISGVLLQGISWSSPIGEPMRVAAIQPNVPLKEKWQPRYRNRILQDFDALNQQFEGDRDLIVWPESALPGYRDQLRDAIDRADERAQATATALFSGLPTRDRDSRYNSITALGAGSGTYHKQKLVPFGEYVPMERWLRGAIDFFDLPMSQFTAGPPNQSPLMANGVSVAAFICYEIVYPDFVQSQSRDAALLVTISNDTWFGNSVGPWQHFQMARYRARELERDLIRSTNDGVSALVDSRGRVLASAVQFSEAVVTGTVQPRAGQTPFAITGSLPILVFGLITLVLGRDRL